MRLRAPILLAPALYVVIIRLNHGPGEGGGAEAQSVQPVLVHTTQMGADRPLSDEGDRTLEEAAGFMPLSRLIPSFLCRLFRGRL